MLRPVTTLHTTSRAFELERIRLMPAGKLLALRKTAPFSKTMTVFNSSRIGWVGEFAWPGRLRRVTLTSRHTGFERGDAPDLLEPSGSDGFRVMDDISFQPVRRPAYASTHKQRF